MANSFCDYVCLRPTFAHSCYRLLGHTLEDQQIIGSCVVLLSVAELVASVFRVHVPVFQRILG